MKNYYTQLSELRIAEERLNTLQEKKKLLEEKITRTTSSQLQDDPIRSDVINDKMAAYVIKCEELDKEIEEKEEEIEILKKGLHKMDEILKHISGIEERVFRLYFMENKTPTQISFIVPCGIATVYRYIKEIKRKYKDDKK